MAIKTSLEVTEADFADFIESYRGMLVSHVTRTCEPARVLYLDPQISSDTLLCAIASVEVSEPRRFFLYEKVEPWIGFPPIRSLAPVAEESS